jgi:Ca2+-binding RTX toxin-like protein
MKLRPLWEGEMDMIEVKTGSNARRFATTLWGLAMLLRIATAVAIATSLLVGGARAALVEGTNRDDLLFGADDDNQQNPVVQPTGASNQSLNNADVMDGEGGDDVMIGLLGSDTMRGGKGNDVMIGGTEQGTQPNSDIMFGDDGRDVAIWRGGDGSDVFIGGRGVDALVMGTIDRDANNIPVIVPATGRYETTGLPTADVTGQNGFCTLEDVRDQDLGYDFLVRFFVKSTGVLAVTMRVADVEQVFCTSESAAAITFADLRDSSPAFVEVSLDEVAELSGTVREIIR